MKPIIVHVIQTQKQKQLFKTQTLIICWNQSINQHDCRKKIDLVIEKSINISKCKPLSSSGYI